VLSLIGLPADPFEQLMAEFDRHGDVLHAFVPGGRRVTIRHPDHIYELLVTNASAFEKRPTDLGPFLGKGLLTSHGALWKKQRQAIQPSFHRAVVEGYTPIVVDATERMLDRWSVGGEVDVDLEMMTLSLVIVCEAMFGHTLESDDPIAVAMRVFFGAVARPGLAPFGHRRAMKAIDHEIFRLIDERTADGADGEDLLSRLLRDTDMPRQQLRDELITMLLAGHETTACALAWTFHLLAMNPEYWAWTADAAKMEQIAGEVLRLYPPAYAVCRVAAADTNIGGIDLTPGDEVIASTYCCHRDPRWFDHPHAFEPQRGEARHPQAYLPFGLGARSCVGKGFGMLELTTVVPAVARRFRLVSVRERIVPDPAITLRPKDGMPMRVDQIIEST